MGEELLDRGGEPLARHIRLRLLFECGAIVDHFRQGVAILESLQVEAVAAFGIATRYAQRRTTHYPHLTTNVIEVDGIQGEHEVGIGLVEGIGATRRKLLPEIDRLVGKSTVEPGGRQALVEILVFDETGERSHAVQNPRGPNPLPTRE